MRTALKRTQVQAQLQLLLRWTGLADTTCCISLFPGQFWFLSGSESTGFPEVPQWFVPIFGTFHLPSVSVFRLQDPLIRLEIQWGTPPPSFWIAKKGSFPRYCSDVATLRLWMCDSGTSGCTERQVGFSNSHTWWMCRRIIKTHICETPEFIIFMGTSWHCDTYDIHIHTKF